MYLYEIEKYVIHANIYMYKNYDCFKKDKNMINTGRCKSRIYVYQIYIN